MSDEENKGGHLTLIAEGDPEKARREYRLQAAQSQLSWAIRELASNLMRILAGGGKSYEIFPQIKALIEAVAACQDAGAPATAFALEQALHAAAESLHTRLESDPDPLRRPTQEDIYRWHDSGSSSIESGKDHIVQAALRVMASRIVGQRTQERTAEHAIFEGIRLIEEGRKLSAKYYSNPKYAEERRRERARQRAEQEQRLAAAAEPAWHQPEEESERARTERPQEGERQRVDRRGARAGVTNKLAGKAARPLPKKIGMYDDLDEKERRARDGDGAE